jgi:chitinase
MKPFMAGVVLTVGASISGCAHHEIVGYYAGWKPDTVIGPRDVTVVNYAFAYVARDGSIVLDGAPMEESAFARLLALKDHNPGLRLMISVGGWTRSNRFSDMAADAAMRGAFIESTIAFLRRHRFDGIDIDWEYPADIGYPCPAGETCQRPEDKHNFVLLARELRAALDAAGAADGKRYVATIAAGADEKFLQDCGRASAWLRELAASLDWINLMSYDYHGSWERVAGLNAPLRHDPADPAGTNVEASVQRLLENGIPAHKITLGIPFYGKGWAGCAPGPAGDGLYQPCAGLASGSAAESFDFAFLTDRGYLSRDRDGLYTVAGPGFVRHWSPAARVPYLYNASNGVFITYDDEASVREKVDLIKEYGLRGAMFWEIGADGQGVLRDTLRSSLAGKKAPDRMR